MGLFGAIGHIAGGIVSAVVPGGGAAVQAINTVANATGIHLPGEGKSKPPAASVPRPVGGSMFGSHILDVVNQARARNAAAAGAPAPAPVVALANLGPAAPSSAAAPPGTAAGTPFGIPAAYLLIGGALLLVLVLKR